VVPAVDEVHVAKLDGQATQDPDDNTYPVLQTEA